MEKQTIKLRLLKFGILLSFLFCYLAWGKENSEFIFQIEYEVFAKNAVADSFIHPLILLPFLGQVLPVISVFSAKPMKRLTTLGILLLGILVIMILIAGSLSLSFKMAGSTLPFVFLLLIYLKISNIEGKEAPLGIN